MLIFPTDKNSPKLQAWNLIKVAFPIAEHITVYTDGGFASFLLKIVLHMKRQYYTEVHLLGLASKIK